MYIAVIESSHGLREYKVLSEVSTQIAADLAKGFHCDHDSVVFYQLPKETTEDQAWEIIETQDAVLDYPHTGNVLYTGYNCDNGFVFEDDGSLYDSNEFSSYEEAEKAGKVYQSEDDALYDLTVEDPSGKAMKFEER